MIKMQNIEIKYGHYVAIKDLSLEIKQGEFFTLLGPSGCGKTTTLRALAGFIQPTKGKIFLKGEDITYKPIEKRGIGMVFQSYALFPTMTVKENIAFGLKENKWSKNKIEPRIKEVSTMVNLDEEQLEKNVSELSGGQQQRVAIARSLALNPEIIVLDEPLSNLDAKLRKSLRVELKKIQQVSGTTMVYVTHDQEEALTLSDRIAVFNNGCIEQIGTPKEIYYHPKSQFVTTFIGDSNLLTTEVVQAINSQNPSMQLNPSHRYYIRAENVLVNSDASAESCLCKLSAKYESEEFYGVTTRRTFRIGNAEIKSISAKNEENLEKGCQVTLYIAKSDLIEFEGD